MNQPQNIQMLPVIIYFYILNIMTSKLKKPSETKDKSENNLKRIAEAYQSFITEKIKSDIQIFGEQAQSLKSHNGQIRKIIQLAKTYRLRAQKYFKDLKEKVSGFQSQKQKYQKILSEFQQGAKSQANKVINLKNQYILKAKQRINIAKTINLKAINKLQIQDRKSESHEIFKWILLVMYKQPTSKYYFDNFKQQVFEQQDQGQDFVQRLGKIPAAQTKQEQKLYTQKILQKSQKISNHEDLSTIKGQIDSILKIVKLYHQGYLVSKKIKQRQSEVIKTKQQRIQKQEMFKKAQNKRDQLQQRMKLTEKYLNVLDNIQNKLSTKQKAYNTISQDFQTVLNQYKKMQKGQFTPLSANYEKEAEKRDAQCSIF